MPPSRVQRHYSHPTTRSVFSPERLLTPPPSTLRTAFTFLDDYGFDEEGTAGQEAAVSTTTRESARVILMSKPRGEVSRAYNLKAQMNSTDKEFAEMQVGFCIYLNCCVENRLIDVGFYFPLGHHQLEAQPVLPPTI